MVQQLDAPTDSKTDNDLIAIFFQLEHTVRLGSDDQLIELLSYLTSTDGSCLPFSYGLFHQRPEIHLSASRIILRLFVQKLGTTYCNPYVKLGLLHRLLPGNPFQRQKSTTRKQNGSRSLPGIMIDVFIRYRFTSQYSFSITDISRANSNPIHCQNAKDSHIQ
jgi:hypothetical protein